MGLVTDGVAVFGGLDVELLIGKISISRVGLRAGAMNSAIFQDD